MFANMIYSHSIEAKQHPNPRDGGVRNCIGYYLSEADFMSKVKHDPYRDTQHTSYGANVKYIYTKTKSKLPPSRYIWSLIHLVVVFTILTTIACCDSGWSIAGWEVK